MAGVFLVLCFVMVLAGPASLQAREDWGSPAGYMSHCSGFTKPAEIPRSQLKHLGFLVQGNGRTRHKYNYWNAKNIAHDPRVDFKRKTLLLALGYLDSPNFPIGTMFANEYEAQGYNVIMLDYQRFTTVHYFLASRLMRPVGHHVAEVLVQLTHAGLRPQDLELFGFSLGGHTVSFIARSFQQMTGQNISTIVSLEPSGPCFRSQDANYRLDASNADFVMVVHTNIDGFGMATPMGHIDFYLNGGEFQPSDISTYPCTVTCSHFRVLPVWLSALRHPNKFLGVKCGNIQEARDGACFNNTPLVVNEMGLGVDKNKTGIYYLSTTKEYPYFMGTKGLKEDNMPWKSISDINNSNLSSILT